MKSLRELIAEWRENETELRHALLVDSANTVSECCSVLLPYAERAEGDEDLIRELMESMTILAKGKQLPEGWETYDRLKEAVRRRLGQG